MRRLVVAVVLWLAVSACGDNPTAPGPLPAAPAPTGALTPGEYLLSVSPRIDQTCSGRMDSWGLLGPAVGGSVVIEADGDGWIGRVPNPQDGDIELRLRVTDSRAGQEVFSGSVRGRLVHFLDHLFSSPPRSVIFGAGGGTESATISGTAMTPAAVGVFGTAEGEITFSHTAGTTATCGQVALLLGRLR